jgi:hypothetical protein
MKGPVLLHQEKGPPNPQGKELIYKPKLNLEEVQGDPVAWTPASRVEPVTNLIGSQ